MGIQIEENINQLLEDRDWTIYRLSKESGVSLSALYSLGAKKRGPNAETLVKISNALDVTVDQLLKGATK